MNITPTKSLDRMSVIDGLFGVGDLLVGIILLRALGLSFIHLTYRNEDGVFGPDESAIAISPQDPSANSPNKLKGGATWAIESANIYNVIRSQPAASSSTISNPYFSSLGGWGHLKAFFNNNLSSIYAGVSMGRTYSYKLERLGRIGV
jgi:hypothetical protein